MSIWFDFSCYHAPGLLTAPVRWHIVEMAKMASNSLHKWVISIIILIACGCWFGFLHRRILLFFVLGQRNRYFSVIFAVIWCATGCWPLFTNQFIQHTRQFFIGSRTQSCSFLSKFTWFFEFKLLFSFVPSYFDFWWDCPHNVQILLYFQLDWCH